MSWGPGSHTLETIYLVWAKGEILGVRSTDLDGAQHQMAYSPIAKGPVPERSYGKALPSLLGWCWWEEATMKVKAA
jgi:hypothetical protein